MRKSGTRFGWVGGSPVLDFVNTIVDRYEPEVRDGLEDYSDLTVWVEESGMLSASVLRRFRKAFARTKEGQRALEQARELRESLHKVLVAVTRGGAPSRAELDRVSDWRKRALANCRLSWRHGDLRCGWMYPESDALSILDPLVDASWKLLLSDRLGRLRECPSPYGCGWLFLDESRNGSRRWCSMETCGNRAKIARYRKRVGRASR